MIKRRLDDYQTVLTPAFATMAFIKFTWSATVKLTKEMPCKVGLFDNYLLGRMILVSTRMILFSYFNFILFFKSAKVVKPITPDSPLLY